MLNHHHDKDKHNSVSSLLGCHLTVLHGFHQSMIMTEAQKWMCGLCLTCICLIFGHLRSSLHQGNCKSGTGLVPRTLP